MHLIDSEIQEQPHIIANLLERRAAIQQCAQSIQAANPTFVMIVARGTSDNAAQYAKYIFGLQLGLPVMLAIPSLTTLYGASLNLQNALVIGISQSGRSDDIVAVIKAAKTQGALTLSITNDATSPMATLSDHHLDVEAGEEKSVAATKSYTVQLAALAALVAEIKGDDALWQALTQLPQWVEQTLDNSQAVVTWIERYRYMERFASIGRGVNYATAQEISLKIKELCYISGEEYSEADFRHGPIALVERGFPIILIMPGGKTYANMRDLLGLLREKGAECICISNNAEVQPLAEKYIAIPEMPEWLSPIAAVIPGQHFARHLASARGYAVDTPRGLSKVTRTT